MPKHQSTLSPRIAVMVAFLALTPLANALIITGGTNPISDMGWPAGSEFLANLPSRVGWMEGPPYGGGQYQFFYRGDTAALQQTLNSFANIRAPQLHLTIHEGRAESPFVLQPNIEDKPDRHYDWSFTIWNAASFHSLYNNPMSAFGSLDPSGAFRATLPPPQLDLYLLPSGTPGALDLKLLKIPPNITIEDARATAHGYTPADGSVAVGDIYDMTTSKPIPNATFVLTTYNADGKSTDTTTAQSDDSGHFELKNIPDGGYQIDVRAGGYAARNLGGLSSTRNSYTKRVIYLAPSKTIAGTIVDAAGKPVPDVSVRAEYTRGIDGRAYLPSGLPQPKTNDQGHFEIPGLPQGYFQLWPTANGYYLVEVMKDYATTDNKITLHLDRTGTIKGRVMKNAAPDAEANVDVWAEGGSKTGTWGGGMKVTTNGTFLFENVPPGKYFISAGSHHAPTENDLNAKPITVESDQTVTVDLTTK